MESAIIAVGRDQHLAIIDAKTLETINQVRFDGYPAEIVTSQDAFWLSVTDDGTLLFSRRRKDGE